MSQWEGRNDRYFDPPDERCKVERDPDQLIDDYKDREMSEFDTAFGYQLKDQLAAMNAVGAQGMKSGIEIGKQESAARIKKLERALKELYEQVQSLDDYTLTRDTEAYKAQACWDDALTQASIVLLGR